MREADNNSLSLFLSVVGAYVVRISSLNDKHSCQLFRIAASFSSLVLLSSSVSTPKLFASDHLPQPLRFLFNSLSSPCFNLLRVARAVSHGFLFSHFRVLSSAFLSSVLQSLKLCLL